MEIIFALFWIGAIIVLGVMVFQLALMLVVGAGMLLFSVPSALVKRLRSRHAPHTLHGDR